MKVRTLMLFQTLVCRNLIRSHKLAELAVLICKSFACCQVDHKSVFHGNAASSWGSPSSSKYSDLWSNWHIKPRNKAASINLPPVWTQTSDITLVLLVEPDRNMTFSSRATFEASTHCIQSGLRGETSAASQLNYSQLISPSHGCRNSHPFIPVVSTQASSLIVIISQTHRVHQATSKSAPFLCLSLMKLTNPLFRCWTLTEFYRGLRIHRD